ncbi:MAG: polymer-forming cytoskeletal protein [Candidatus Cloacimonetes bacterium]|nr:polymer-forming cytoskeletal protein [Candidatus Cloacimonadota bacterium]
MARNKKVELSTIIGKGSKIKGSLIIEGGIRIDGKVEGSIESDGFVTIGLSGVAKADIKADECLVSGKVEGNIVCEDALELDRTANLTGDIIAKVLKIHTGAVFNGTSKMNKNNKPAVAKTFVYKKDEEEKKSQ